MLLKSTGSLRRKRAENSPVWRTGNRGKGIHERTTHRSCGSRDGVKITRVKMWRANYQVELVQNLELTQQFRPNCCQRFLKFYIKHLKLDNFDRRWPLRVKINSVCLPQAPHYCLVSPPATDANSPPTFLHPRYDTAVVPALHGSKLSHGDVVGDPLRRDDVHFLELNIYKPKDVVTNWREK